MPHQWKGAGAASQSRTGVRTPRYGKVRGTVPSRPLPTPKELAEAKARRLANQ